MAADATDRICSACLMSGALAAADDETVSVASARRPAPAAAELPCAFVGYRLLRLLGTGGMGTVYEAEQLATGRRVALKMLGHQLDSPEMRQRFLRESRLAASVNHPNSLYVFGSEEIDGTPVITVEITASGTPADGHATLLDEPWPVVTRPAERMAVGDTAGQQRFLIAVAASVEPTNLPLHARPVLQNLERGRFEKLSFLSGTLRGLLDRPAEVSRGIRAGAVFMLPLYVWTAVFVGHFHDKPWSDAPGEIVIVSVLVALAAALAQLLELPFRTTASHATFRLAVIDGRGEPAAVSRMLVRWAIAWLPLLVPLSFVALLIPRAEGIAFASALVLLILWVGAAGYAVVHPNRGLHDRLAGTWVVRR